MRAECFFGDGELHIDHRTYNRRRGWVKGRVFRLADKADAWAHTICIEEMLQQAPPLIIEEARGAFCWFCNKSMEDPRDSFARVEAWYSSRGVIPVTSPRGWAHSDCVEGQHKGIAAQESLF